MLSDPSSIYFQTELQFLPIDDLEFGKQFVRGLYHRLSEPGGYSYENLQIQDEFPHMFTERSDGRSVCSIGEHEIAIEEDQPEVGVDGFVEITETVLGAASIVADNATPPIFCQKCKIRCVARPHECENSIELLAGNVADVLERIEPFGRPPAYFGVRFRFPPFEMYEEDSEGNETALDTRKDYSTLRFETWGRDVRSVWMELTAVHFFSDPIEITEITRISENIRQSYDFLTDKSIQFLNQYDKPYGEESDDNQDDSE